MLMLKLTFINGFKFLHRDVIDGEKLRYEHRLSSYDLAKRFVIKEAYPIIAEVKVNIRGPVHG